MIVQLSPTAAPVLADLDRLDRLHADCPGAIGDMQLDGWCEPDADGSHLWLDVAACRTVGVAEQGDDWGDAYDGMIAYATSKGWTNEAGTHVRAHIETTGA